jgi:uncharacterized protein YutE (UPF0331/DUF86 family)
LLPSSLASRLAAAASLRNLLTHGYRVVDDRRVYESARRGVGDFREFISYVRGLSG